MGLAHLGGYLFKVLYHVSGIKAEMDGDCFGPEDRKLEEFAAQTGAIGVVIGRKLSNMTARDWIRCAVSNCTEIWLSSKLISAIGSFCKKTAKLCAITARHIKETAQAVEVIKPVVAGLPNKAGMLFSKIEGQAGKVGTIESKIGKAVEQETKQVGSQITQATGCPASCSKQYEQLKHALKAEELASTKSIGNTQKIEFMFKELSVEKKFLEATTKKIALTKLEKIGAQLPNKLKETIKDATTKFQDFNIFLDPNKNYIVSMTKPGNVPGSKAIYYKVVDPTGRTLEVFKDTFDNLGKFVHRKYKTLL